MKSNYLFYTKGKLSDFLEERKEKIRQLVSSLPQNEIEKGDSYNISRAMIKKYTLLTPALRRDRLKKIIEKDTQIKIKEKVPYKTGRLAIGPREKTIFVDAKEAIVEIPFTGDKRLFDYQPEKYVFTIPKGEIVGDRLRFRLIYQKEEDVPFDLRIRHQLERIEFYLKGVFEEVDAYNRSLPDYINELIEKRKAK